MGIKSVLSKPFASFVNKQTLEWSKKPGEIQKKVFDQLIKGAYQTQFGKDHGFDEIRSASDFAKQVPIRDYEGLKPYVEKIIAGHSDVLWKGKPTYFAKTSGTTSGVKYIPISKESISTHINSARDAILSYIYYTGNAKIFFGKQIFLQGSPTLEIINEIKTGRLSGIVAHHVPKYLQRSRMPTWNTNCIEDWEKKS